MSHRVLIVDGQRGASRLLRSALETIEQGLLVADAQSGEEAMLEIHRQRFDLLVTDFLLPGINGLELKKKFQASNPDGRVIITLGTPDPHLQQKIAQAGADAFFQKPIPMSDFLVAVEDCLGLVRTVMRLSEPAVTPPVEKKPGVGDLLVHLRQSMEARAVLLIDATGSVIAQAGQVRGADNPFPLLSALSALFMAAQKTMLLIDQAGTGYMTLFAGANLDAIFMPLGPSHALLVVGNNLADTKKLPNLLEVLQPLLLDLQDALKEIGIAVETSVANLETANLPEQIVVQEEVSLDFMNIFEQTESKAINVDEFWESAVEKGVIITASDQLTYEQASRLGLAPDSPQVK